MPYGIALQIATYTWILMVATFVQIWGFWALKRYILDS